MIRRIIAAAALAILPYSHGTSAQAQEKCPAVIVEVFGYLAHDACYVAWAESKWRAGATGSLGERGLFQIHPVHFDSTYDAYGNAMAAYRLSRGGHDWCTHWRWTCS